ncbi:LuxR C-terminal-related transcriptional regulator [Nonomuraea sp. NPDC050663]|uniref:helix-turn-helix transcriptional regulator n=1 Tax=Nonomuraea sp. NPDC050663 TaxID=3364370 RepID=UPI0037A08984
MVAFVGRTAERTAIRDALRDRAGILVVGEPGAGKSRLLAEAVRGPGVVRVSGAGPQIAFGAFAHLLSGEPQGLNPVRWAAGQIEAEVLVVDDAHLLDPHSAALVGHLAEHYGVRLAAAAVSGAALPRPLVELWKEGRLARLDLGPLPAPDSARLLSLALGGQVEGLTSRRLWHATRGNARFLVELVTSGPFVHSGGLWRWPGEIVLTERLRLLVEAAIGEVDEQERSVLEYVAFGEPLELATLIELAGTEPVERMERRGLISVGEQPLRVQLAHPLYAQVIRTWTGPVRTRGHLARVIPFSSGDQQISELSGREKEIARLASWNLTNREIADLLTVSPRTVGNHLCRIYSKLGVNHRLDLARLLA